jgi:two-component system, OmpR family, phosphate regulon sensor histidine kinase PhoR
MAEGTHRGRIAMYLLLLMMVAAVVVLVGGIMFRASRNVDRLRDNYVLEATNSVAIEKVEALERLVIEQDNVVESLVDVSRPLRVGDVWLPTAIRETPTVRAVLIVDDNSEEHTVLGFASRASVAENEAFRRILIRSMWPEFKLGKKPEQLHHLHVPFREKSYLVSYWQRKHLNQKYLVIVWHDVPRLVHDVFPRLYGGINSKNSRVNIVDEQGKLVFGAALPAGGFTVGRPFPTTLYGWRLQVALTAADELGDQVERRRHLEVGLVTTSCAVILLGVIFLLFAVEKERRLSAQKNEFVANVSHELKTPLSLVRMFAELLLSQRVPNEAKKREYLQIILVESERLSALIENVLDFARVERGKSSFDFAEGDLGEAVLRAVDMYRFRAEREGIDIHVNAPIGLGRVRLDYRAIELAIINLLDNALKYAGSGKQVKIGLERKKQYIEISVEDQGPGIRREDQKRIFERFWRGQSARQARIRGTGIGLSLVKHIAESHGGYTHVWSEPDKGSRFVIGVPLLPSLRSASTEENKAPSTLMQNLPKLDCVRTVSFTMFAPTVSGWVDVGPHGPLSPSTVRKSGFWTLAANPRQMGALEVAMGRYADGQEAAFAEVYDLAAPRLYSFLLRLCRDTALAEDLTHEAFLRIHRARGMYRKDADVLPWAFAISRRLFLDHVRSRRHEKAMVDRSHEDRPSDPGIPSNEAMADDQVSAKRLAAEIERILENIPETQATAFRLLKQEGMSVAEAAEVLGATQTTVKLRAHRAYEALRKSLGSEWDIPQRTARGESE